MKLIIAGSRHIQIDDKRVGFEVVDRMLRCAQEAGIDICQLIVGVDL